MRMGLNSRFGKKRATVIAAELQTTTKFSGSVLNPLCKNLISSFGTLGGGKTLSALKPVKAIKLIKIVLIK